MNTHEVPVNAAEVIQTTILNEEQVSVQYPYCVLPPHFFERVVYLKRTAVMAQRERSRTVLSVQTWDGRDVMSVLSD